MGASTKATEKRTACTRRCHFIYWCVLRKVYDQVFPVVQLSDTALVYLLACYTAFLATGHAIGLKSIKSGTIDGYLLTIAKFLKNFDEKVDRDARMFSGSQVIAPPIKKVIEEMKRFEKQPNRREPWTLQLQSRLVKETEDEPADSLAKSGCQWFIVVFPAGCRRIEWCQPYASRDPSKVPDLNAAKDTYAFCVDDIQFLGASHSRISKPHAIDHRQEVRYVELTFRMQKNGINGEVKRYARNRTTPSLDAVEHWIVIIERFHRLVGLEEKQRPLAIYYDYDKKKVQNICSDDSKRLLQNTVRLEYGITDIKDLSKWTNHSIRVGMACLLQAQGKAGDYIQRVLRWRSETWKLYTRNLWSESIDLSNTMTNEMESINDLLSAY
jgi:hypothetical protein